MSDKWVGPFTAILDLRDIGDHPLATKGSGNSSERSKVRVVMVEFEGPSGDLHQLTQTLANAVRPQQIVIQNLPGMPQLQGLPLTASSPNGNTSPTVDTAPAVESTSEDASEFIPPVRNSGGATKRKLKSPKLVENLEFNSGDLPFKEYMEQVDASDHLRRYLGITFWLREKRQLEEVGADHVYTCYRFLGLPIPEDVTGPFRKLKQLDWVAAGSSAATYKLTHIGENELTKALRK